MINETYTTIAAPATALTPAGLAVIRISGPKTAQIIQKLFRSNTDPLKSPRQLIHGQLIGPDQKQVLDSCLIVFFPGPNSFTGEDVCELHLHGSPLLVQLALRNLYQQGALPAEPGEFSKRAYLNGKLDLTQTEAIADIIHAGSEMELKLAQEQLAGRLKKLVQHMGEPLKDILAEIEAHIDFPEEDINPSSLSELKAKLELCLNQINQLLASYSYGKVVREGLRVLIFGEPNVGKSSLLNYFLKEDRAIVTPISGTTRDLLEETALVKNHKVVFCDSAGITDTKDEVEKIGIERAKNRLAWADLVLLVISSEHPEADSKIIEKLKNHTGPVWIILNKVDLSTSVDVSANLQATSWLIKKISVLKEHGLSELENQLTDFIESQNKAATNSSVVLTNERHRLCLEQSLIGLANCLNSILENQPLEIISADLRLGINSLSELIGAVNTEDLLGRIFSKFCIGK